MGFIFLKEIKPLVMQRNCLRDVVWWFSIFIFSAVFPLSFQYSPYFKCFNIPLSPFSLSPPSLSLSLPLLSLSLPSLSLHLPLFTSFPLSLSFSPSPPLYLSRSLSLSINIPSLLSLVLEGKGSLFLFPYHSSGMLGKILLK